MKLNCNKLKMQVGIKSVKYEVTFDLVDFYYRLLLRLVLRLNCTKLDKTKSKQVDIKNCKKGSRL